MESKVGWTLVAAGVAAAAGFGAGRLNQLQALRADYEDLAALQASAAQHQRRAEAYQADALAEGRDFAAAAARLQLKEAAFDALIKLVVARVAPRVELRIGVEAREFCPIPMLEDAGKEGSEAASRPLPRPPWLVEPMYREDGAYPIDEPPPAAPEESEDASEAEADDEGDGAAELGSIEGVAAR